MLEKGYQELSTLKFTKILLKERSIILPLKENLQIPHDFPTFNQLNYNPSYDRVMTIRCEIIVN